MYKCENCDKSVMVIIGFEKDKKEREYSHTVEEIGYSTNKKVVCSRCGKESKRIKELFDNGVIPES